MRIHVLMIVLVLVAGSAVAGKPVPFKGNLDGSTVPRVNPALERFEASGHATHLGHYTLVAEADLNLIQIIGIDPVTLLPIATLPLSAVFTAANGDEVHVDMVMTGLFHPVDLNFPSFTVVGTVIGGTGRFASASGSLTGSGGQTTVPGEDNDLISGEFSGTIER